MTHGMKFLAFIFFVSSAANVWIFINRGDLTGLEWSEASLGDVYALPPTGPRIEGFSYERDVLTIQIENIGPCRGWRIQGPGGLNIESADQHPSLPLTEGTHTYTIDPIHCDQDPVKRNLTFTFLKQSQEKVLSGDVSEDVIRLVNMPLVFSLRDGPDFTRWYPPLDDFGERDIQRARAFLDEHGITDAMSSLEKVARISHALHSTLPTGSPPAYLNGLSPMQIMDEALNGKAEVFCRQHALTQAFLSNVAGVPTRIVGSGRVLDGVMLSGHGFVESYIEEQSRWAYSDLSHVISYVTDPNGNVLSAADVMSVVSSNAGGNLTPWFSEAETPVQKPWTEVQKRLDPWFNKNTSLVYWGGHDRSTQHIHRLPFWTAMRYRVQRYLFEPTYYLGYQHSYDLHWLRGAMILVSLVSGLALGGLWMRAWRNESRPRTDH